MPGNISGPGPTRALAIEPRHRPPGQRWILEAGLRGGGVRVGRPFGGPVSCKGLGSVTLKINTQHTRRNAHGAGAPSLSGSRALLIAGLASS